MVNATSASVASLHTNIAQVVKEVSKANLHIVSNSHRVAWENLPRDTTLTFEFETIPDQKPAVLTDYVDRTRGGRSFVFRLIERNEEDPTLWAGWFEEWKTDKDTDNLYNLVALSWTFYWGAYMRPRPNILRADWDALSGRSQRAAQPHWHIDPSMLLTTYSRVSRPPQQPPPEQDELVELPEEAGGLEELTASPSGLQEVSMSGMHLGMGGWHHATENPACWRREIPRGWNDVTEWVKRTLRYAIGQFTEEFSYDPPVDMT